jgi:RHS repeat-associated protein
MGRSASKRRSTSPSWDTDSGGHVDRPALCGSEPPEGRPHSQCRRVPISDTTCWAVGSTVVSGSIEPAVYETTTSGASWTAQSLGSGLTGTIMYSISCTSASDCWAAGLSGSSLVIYATTNGGSSWGLQSTSTTGILTDPAISCLSSTPTGTCVVVTGDNALATTNGTAWNATSLTGISSPLDGVSCPTTSTCFATTTNGSASGVAKLSGGTSFYGTGASTWSSLTLGLTVTSLSGISCTSASVCTTGGLQVATDTAGSGVNIGSQGATIATSNGGTSWTSSLANGNPPTNLLPNAVLIDGLSFFSCPTTTVCLGGGPEGVVAQNASAGPWTGVFLTPVLSTTNQINCASPLACFLSPASDVTYRSSGGGAGWDPENLPSTETNTSTTKSGPTSSVSESSCNTTSMCGFLGTTTDGADVEGWSSDGETWGAIAGSATGNDYAALSCLTTYCIDFNDVGSSPTETAFGPCTTSSTCPTLTPPTSMASAASTSCVGTEDCWVVGMTTSTVAGVWGTTNGGATWTSESLLSTTLGGATGFSGSSISCADANDCVIANTAGAFANTTNGGMNWSTLPVSGPVTSESSLSCPDADDCAAVVGTSSGTELLALTDTAGVWSSTLDTLPTPYTTASSMTCADAAECWVLAGGSTGGPETVLSTNGETGPLDGPLTPGESFAGNQAESQGQVPQAWAGNVNTADGDYSESLSLVDIPAKGSSFGLSLTYDAQLAQDQVAFGATSPGRYGWGWTGSNDLSITTGPLSNQVTVNQEGGSQIVYTEGSTVSGVTSYTPLQSHRVLTTLTYSTASGDYSFSFNGGLEEDLFSASGPLAVGTFVKEVDANGNTTTFGTEAKNHGTCPNTSGDACYTITDPAGRIITEVYATSTGLVSKVIDPLGNVWKLTYSTKDLTTVEDPNGKDTTFAYDTGNANANLVHDMIKITSPNAQSGGPDAGDLTSIGYDPLGRVFCQIAPVKYATIGACPTYGSTITSGATSYQYSGSDSTFIGGTTTITDPHGNKTSQDYSEGVLVASTSGIGTAAPATTSHEYDTGVLMATRVTDPDGHTSVSTYYNGTDNLKSMTDPLGNITTYGTYNTFNEPSTVTDPNGITTTYTYDSYGNQLTKTVSAPGMDSGPPGWSKASVDSGVTIEGVSCPSATLCVGVDHSGNVLSGTNPIGGPSAWSLASPVSAASLNGVSCPSTGLCVAVGSSGQIASSAAPTGGHTAWSSITADGSITINAVSCVSSSLCVAADADGNVLVNTGSGYVKTNIDGTNSIVAVSCPSTALCIATDTAGNVLSNTNPTGSTAWTKVNIDGSTSISSVSCPTATFCAVTDSTGDVLTTTNGGTSWTKTDIDGTTGIDAVSCGSVTLCVATDGNGAVLTATKPTGGVSAWTKSDIDGNTPIDAVNCPTPTECVAGDGSGNLLGSDDAAGTSTWSKSVVESGITIAGLSCPATSLCVGVDHSGNELWSTGPTTGSWDTAHVSAQTLEGVSCPTTDLCVAVGTNGVAVVSTSPTGGTWTSTTADGTTTVNAVSCPSTTLCVAADARGNVLVNNPTVSATWTPADIDGTTSITAVSCPSTALCVAIDSNGNVLSSSNPTGGISAWGPSHIDGTTSMTSVSCPTATLCVATDSSGNAFTATNPNGGVSAWTKTDIDGSTAIVAVSCATVALCVATDASGTVLTAVGPTLGVWAQADIDGSTTLGAVSCPSVNDCVAGDASGAVVSSADAEGMLSVTTVSTYDPSGDLLTVTDPDGHVTTFTYDTEGDIVTTSVTVGSQVDTTSASYDEDGQKYCQVSPNANAASVACPAYLATRVADTTTWAFDADGNVTSTTDANNHTTSYVYDDDNNKTKTTDAQSNVTETTYDADDRALTVTSGYGTSSASTTTNSYDIAPGTGSCSSGVTLATYCTTVENGLSNVTTSYYNALDQLVESSPPSPTAQTATTYTYDGAGNTLSKTDGSGTTKYTYDVDNRVIFISYSNAPTGYQTPTQVGYQYDADGNRTKMTDGTGSTTYFYDSLNRLQSVTDGVGNTVTYADDPGGNDTCLSYPNSGITTCQNALSGTGLVAYGYDAANRTVSMADWLHPATPTVFTYDNDSNLTGTTLATYTPITVADNYDDTDALVGVSGVSTLTRNTDEEIGTTTPPSLPTVTYGYDPLNRVTTGTAPSDTTGATTGYTYDAGSEVTSTTPSGGSAVDYAYNSDGQLCWTASTTASCTSPPTGATTYTYTGAGARLTKTGSGSNPTTYEWDQAGDLVCETVSNSAGYTCSTPNYSYTSTYFYNGDGLRMSDVVAGTSGTEQFTWDVSGSVPRLIECRSLYYLYGPNVMSAPIEEIAVGGSPTNQYLVSDPTGVRELISSSGTLITSASYDSYGNPCSLCSVGAFGFEGGYVDSTGLIYLDHRYYDPTTGQFISVDPDVASTGEPYAFAGADPVNGNDPSGLFESGPGGQRCIGASSCNTLAVPINSCGMECASTSGSTSTTRGPGDPTEPQCQGPGPVSEAQMAGCSDYGISSGKAPAYTNSGTAQWNNLLNTFGAIALPLDGPGDAAANTIVIGRYPDYLDLGSKLGADTFNVPGNVWDLMNSEQRWAANQEFLDNAIANGSKIRLASPPGLAPEGSYYERELVYLESQGYTVSSDGTTMLAPSG